VENGEKLLIFIGENWNCIIARSVRTDRLQVVENEFMLRAAAVETAHNVFRCHSDVNFGHIPSMDIISMFTLLNVHYLYVSSVGTQLNRYWSWVDVKLNASETSLTFRS
jgi:hypothetical protein